jgi:predicted transcriptional regulator YheO
MKSRSSSYSPRKSKGAKISSDTSHKNHGNNEIESLLSINTNITENIAFVDEIMKKSTTTTGQPDVL